MGDPFVKIDPFHVQCDFPDAEKSPKIRCYSRITKWFLTTFTKTEVWQYTADPSDKSAKVYYLKAQDIKEIDPSIQDETGFSDKISKTVKQSSSKVVRQVVIKANKWTTTKGKLLKDLENIQKSDVAEESDFAKRVLASFAELKKSADTITKKTGKKKTGKKLSERSILRICIVAESIIAKKSADLTYVKKTDSQIERSLLVDMQAKSWTVVVGDVIDKGASKKVKSAMEVAVHQAEKSATVRSFVVAVNRKGETLEDTEVEKIQRFAGDSRGIVSIRNIAHYQKTNKQGCTVEKQIFAQERARGNLRSLNNHTSEELKSIASDCCYGLKRMHKENMVHRDIKPANILLFDDGAKLADFGIAGNVDEDQGVFGTYIAPEFFTNGNHHGFAADVYTLGAVLYELKFKKLPPGLIVWDKVFTIDSETDEYMLSQSKVNERVSQQQEIVRELNQLEKRNKDSLTDDDRMNLLIYQMLHPDPEKRITAENAFEFLEKGFA